jgi:predicted metal-dependent phosphotriesterase family hydrolase
MMYLMHYLLDRGLGNRILYGMDTNFHLDDEGAVWLEAQREHPETAARVYSYTLTGAKDLMRRWGFTDADFHQFLVENPRSLFSTTRV